MPKGRKKGMRLGRGNKEAAIPVSPNATTDELLERVMAEAPLKYPSGLELARRVLRMLLLEEERLIAGIQSGKLSAEEAKAINANASNQRRWFEAIGMTGAPGRGELKDGSEDDGPL